MPKRSADQGVKPFEFRAGAGGLPAFGGMFRSGDPAIVPPQKFQVLVNMRVEPVGLVTRPGLGLVFNTGVQECINGLTEDAGEQGGAVMLYPGATGVAGNGTPGFNSATFRAIFPDSSVDYSEYVFVPYGLPSTDRGTLSPVLAYTQGGPSFERPFIFRGQAVQFKIVQRNGVDTVALLGMNLSDRSFLQASDCSRAALGPGDNYSTGDPCPGVSGQVAPANFQAQPLWPYDYPIGSSNVLVYFDSPWSPDPGWEPDGNGPGNNDFFLTRQERIDDPLTGIAGVSEVLYFVATSSLGRRLVRWDGSTQTTEAVVIPDFLQPALGDQTYGPFLVSTSDLPGGGGPNDWAAFRTESGAWSVIAGAGFAIPGLGYNATAVAAAAFSWGGRGYAVTVANYNIISGITELEVAKIDVWAQSVAAFDVGVGGIADQCEETCSVGGSVSGVAVGTDRVFILGSVGGIQSADLPWLFTVGLGFAGQEVLSIPSSASTSSIDAWIQNVGGRIYVGGKFINWNPLTATVEPGVTHHGVYDVTSGLSSIFNVYRVAETEQLEDAGYGPGARYSRGALPAVPGGDTGGEGFQAS